MIYKPVKGSTLNKDEAQKYGERIATLEEELGGVTPENVLSDAHNKKSPLHEFFEWNDKIAASNYRLTQARYLLRSINVIVKKPDGQEEEVRAFHPVKVKVVTAMSTTQSTGNGTLESVADSTEQDTNKRYVSIQRALSDEEWKQQIINNAFRELEAWRRKYAIYRELAKVVEMVDKVIQQKEVV